MNIQILYLVLYKNKLNIMFYLLIKINDIKIKIIPILLFKVKDK